MRWQNSNLSATQIQTFIYVNQNNNIYIIYTFYFKCVNHIFLRYTILYHYFISNHNNILHSFYSYYFYLRQTIHLTKYFLPTLFNFGQLSYLYNNKKSVTISRNDYFFTLRSERPFYLCTQSSRKKTILIILLLQIFQSIPLKWITA